MALTLASAAPARAEAPARPAWWQAFADPALDALMTRIERDNTTLSAAVAKLALARANARLDQAGAAPQVGLATSANYAAGPLINAAGGSGALFTGSLAAAWEPDLFGRLKPVHRADTSEIRAAEADLAAARLLVQTSAARAWYAVAALGQVRSKAALALDLATEAEARTRRCFAQGSCTAAQVAQRALARSAASDRLSQVERQETETRDALAYLLGARALDGLVPSPVAQLPAIPAGLDADIVARRPDVAAAEARLEAATARRTAAQRDWLPHFALTAAGGTASTTLVGLLTGGAGSIGLGLLADLPLFDGGRHKARVAFSGAAEDLAQARMQDALLAAFRDANDALALNQQALAAEREARARASEAQAESARLARASARGSASSLELAGARMAELDAAQAATIAQLGQVDARLRLVLALGGGW